MALQHLATTTAAAELLPHNLSANGRACYNHTAFETGDRRQCQNSKADSLVNIGNGVLRPLCGSCAGELAVLVAAAFVFVRQQKIG